MLVNTQLITIWLTGPETITGMCAWLVSAFSSMIHCPWAGHCVGARIHRVSACSLYVCKILLIKHFRQFFFIFCFQWAILFCAWKFSTLVGFNTHASHNQPNVSINDRHVAIIVMWVLLSSSTRCLPHHVQSAWVFTTALDITHAVLIPRNMTILEQMAVHCTKERGINKLFKSF